jgi:hypothetical protein
VVAGDDRAVGGDADRESDAGDDAGRALLDGGLREAWNPRGSSGSSGPGVAAGRPLHRGERAEEHRRMSELNKMTRKAKLWLLLLFAVQLLAAVITVMVFRI